MRLTRTTAVILFTLATVTAMVAGVTMGQSLSISGPDSSTNAAAGDTVSVEFTVTNSGANTTDGVVTVDGSTLPSNWSVTDLSGTDPNPQDQFAVISSETQVTFSDIDGNETVTVTANVSVPSDASAGNATLEAVLESGEGTRLGTAEAEIVVSEALSFASGDAASVQLGGTTGVEFTVTNQGSSTESATVAVNTSSAPATWTVSDLAGDDPNPQDEFAVIENATSVTFSDIDADETVTVTATVEVPADASLGDFSLSAELTQDGQSLGTASTGVTVVENVTERYDRDKDGVETTELVDGVKDWRTGHLTAQQLLDLLDIWKANK